MGLLTKVREHSFLFAVLFDAVGVVLVSQNAALSMLAMAIGGAFMFMSAKQ